MKPRLFRIFLAGLAMLTLAGCGTARFTQPSALEQPLSSDEVTLAVKEDSLSDGGLVLEITSHVDRELTYGMDYTIEQYRDGAWYAMGGDRIIPSIAAILMPGETNEFSVTWDKALSQGRYRVVKPVNTSQGTQDLAVEFAVK